MTVPEIYQFYNDYTKPIYSEIEARDNTLPVELLFETYSAFDHLKRFYVDKQEEAKSCEKAHSHLIRGVLDAFKLKLKYFNDDIKKLRARKIDFNIIDSGEYITSFIIDKNNIVNRAKEARLLESSQNKKESFEKWYDVSFMIDDFYNKYFNESKLYWARIKTLKMFGFIFVIGLITGLISSCIIGYLFNFIICK